MSDFELQIKQGTHTIIGITLLRGPRLSASMSVKVLCSKSRSRTIWDAADFSSSLETD
jgi:hypothetical protein